MPMGFWDAAVEVVKATAWPVAAVVMVRSLKSRLGDFLASLAQRKVAAKALGAEVTLEAPVANQKLATDNAEKAAELPPAPAAPVQAVAPSDNHPAELPAVATAAAAAVLQPERLLPADRASVNDLETVLLEKLQESEPQARVPMLLRALAETRINLAFEIVYRVIFGSQIAFLRILHPATRLPRSAAFEAFHSRAMEIPDMAVYGFDNWLAFLRGNGLVNVEGEAIEITNLGRDFIVYMAKNALPDSKPW